jgi:hypothetical protein
LGYYGLKNSIFSQSIDTHSVGKVRYFCDICKQSFATSKYASFEEGGVKFYDIDFCSFSCAHEATKLNMRNNFLVLTIDELRRSASSMISGYCRDVQTLNNLKKRPNNHYFA